jgi:DNA-binding PadR family transcriptional regulator
VSAKHAVLGLLLQRDAYPYELADRLRSRLGPAWAINSGQLSHTIRTLEREGLIERVVPASAARSERNVFSITKRGSEEFERWWREDEMQGVRLARRPLLLKLALAGADRLRTALDQVESYEHTCAQRIGELVRQRDDVPLSGFEVRADHVLLRLSLSADIFQLEGELHWARQAHEVITWLLNTGAVWPSRAAPPAVEDPAHAARRELFGRMAAAPEPSRRG